MDLDKLLKFILALIMTGLFGYMIYVLFVSGVVLDDNVRDMANVLLGSLVMLTKDVYGFVFGSSQGSKEKSELIQSAVVKNSEKE